MSRVRTICRFLAAGGALSAIAFFGWAGVSKAQLKKIRTDTAPQQAVKRQANPISSEVSVIDGSRFGKLPERDEIASPRSVQAGVVQGEEIEPNGTAATATALGSAETKIKGNVNPNGDLDFYSFAAIAGDRVYAAVQTSTDPIVADQDSTLAVLASDGTTVLEQDLNDGTFGAASSSIAGTIIPTTGTYYLRVQNASATVQTRPYNLYLAVRSGAPAPEVEANNSIATATPLAASGWMSGSVNPAADADFYSVSLNAGDTVFLSLDIDPERNNVQWNGRLGFALFGTGNTQILVVNDTSAGSAANPLSEAFFFTVKDAGTYYVYVDEPAAGGGATLTYNLSASVFPAASSVGCTIYSSTDVPKTIPATAPPILVSSIINVPSTPNRIRKVSVFLDVTHTFMTDLDVHLVSPAGNDNGLFTNVGAGTTGGPQTSMNWWIDDDAAIPPSFSLSATMRHQPEATYRMDWFNGEDPSGTWRLDIRDEFNVDGGTLNNWSLEICEAPAPSGTVLYSENFESTNGSYTHSGTQDEWAYGTPNTPATGTAAPPPVAAFIGCGGGLNCWKTDLVNTYNANSNQDLVSPAISLVGIPYAVKLSWAMRYQMENASSDHASVIVRQAGTGLNPRTVWQWTGPTMTDAVGAAPVVNIGASAGWGLYTVDISDFAGQNVEVVFHLDSNGTNNFGGLAIDDVAVRALVPVAAGVGVSGWVHTDIGMGISRARVTLVGQDGIARVALTNSFGYYSFENVTAGSSYSLSVDHKFYKFDSRVLSVTDSITDADFVPR